MLTMCVILGFCQSFLGTGISKPQPSLAQYSLPPLRNRVLPQGKKLGKQLGQLEAAGFAGAAFMDKDEVKIFAQQ